MIEITPDVMEDDSWYTDDSIIDDSEFVENGDQAFIDSCKCLVEIKDTVEQFKGDFSKLTELSALGATLSECDENVIEIESESESDSDATVSEIDSQSESESEYDEESQSGSEYDEESEPESVKDDKDFARYTI